MYQTINRCMPGIDMTMIDQAVEYAQEKHKFQKRKDGSPYIIHPLAVAEIVAEMGLDMDAILGALLHDCIEDTDLKIKTYFPPKFLGGIVAFLLAFLFTH